jgi:energy-coupling factor transport system ATP-binding protein
MIDLENLTYTYPFHAAPAVEQINFHAAPGTLTLVTGPGGCGKSTLARLINGLAPHYFRGRLEGRVRVCGQDSAQRTIQEISADVGTLLQDPESQFFALDVAEELGISLRWQGVGGDALRRRVRAAAARLGIASILSRQTLQLSEGQKQKVALAAILASDPQAVVLDEPSANLDPESVRDLAHLLASWRDLGKTIVVFDHRLYWLENLADYVYVMHKGRMVYHARGSDFFAESEQARSFGLRSLTLADPRATLPRLADCSGRALVEMRGISFGYGSQPLLMEDFSQGLPAGTVTGCIGPNGTGKTTLAQILCGLQRPRKGAVAIRGRVVAPKNLPRHNSLILQNTDYQLHMDSVRREMEVCSGHIPPAERLRRQDAQLDHFGLGHLAERHPQSLSGGERQRLVLACEALREPSTLILDEPTSGLDGQNMHATARCIRNFADQGTAVLVITHDLELLREVCDFVLCFPLVEPPEKAAAGMP